MVFLPLFIAKKPTWRLAFSRDWLITFDVDDLVESIDHHLILRSYFDFTKFLC